MHTQHPTQMIVSLPVKRLHPHPENPNRMSQARFKKLIHHIHTTGQYEPIVVRKHPTKKGSYQILNGTHRVRAIKHLELSHVDCVVFNADDDAARVYLLTLNKLIGRDNAFLRTQLIGRLSKRIGSGPLSRLLAESKKAIETSVNLSQNKPVITKPTTPLLVPMTFFMNEQEHTLIQRAFEKAANDSISPHSQRRLDALLQMAQTYLKQT